MSPLLSPWLRVQTHQLFVVQVCETGKISLLRRARALSEVKKNTCDNGNNNVAPQVIQIVACTVNVCLPLNSALLLYKLLVDLHTLYTLSLECCNVTYA